MRLFDDTLPLRSVLPLEDVRLFTDMGSPGPEALSGLPPEVRDTLMREADEAAARPVASLPASLYLQYARIGNRETFEAAYFSRRVELNVLHYAQSIAPDNRYLDAIVDRVWAILEESTWVLPAHNLGPLCGEFDEVRRVDLFSAATAALLSAALHLLGDRLDTGLLDGLLSRRMRYEIKRRVLDPVRKHDQFWLRNENNWNTWICSNVLFCLTACEENMANRLELVNRILRALDVFVDSYAPDGGCNEGPSYWNCAGGCLFDALELLADLTGGAVDKTGEPLVRLMGEYLMKMHIAGDYFAAFADAPHRVLTDNVLLARFGHRAGSEALERFGLSRIRWSSLSDRLRQGGGGQNTRSYRAYKDYQFLAHPRGPREPYRPALCHVLENLQILTAREFPEEGRGFFAALKGGHNGESHNHNDVGTFLVYLDGEPLFADAGVDTYSRTTFGPNRYSLWYMQSRYHNLPDVAGLAQRDGGDYHGEITHCDPAGRTMELELRAAYPAEAGIRSFRRRLSLEEGAVTVTDRFALEKPGDVEEHYLFPVLPDLSQPGVMAFPGGVRAAYDPSLEAVCEPVSLLTRVDLAPGQSPRGQMARNWGRDALYRVTLSARQVTDAVYTLRITR